MFSVAYHKRDITPFQPEPLIGFMQRVGKSEGVLDPIYVKVLLLKSKYRTIVWVSFETLAITRQFSEEIREKLKQNFNFDYVSLSATHTHFAPALKGHTWFNSASAEYEEYVYKQLKEALIEAMNSFKEAKIGFKKCYFDEVGHSRIMRQADHHHTYLSLLSFHSLDDEPIVSMITYNCHPTVLGQNFNQVSGDYITDLTNKFEKEAHDCIFFQGVAGDISTRYTRTRKDAIEQKEYFGKLIAKKLLLMHKQLKFNEVHSFSYLVKDVLIEYKDIDRTAIEQELAVLENEYKDSKDRFLETKIQGCKVLLKMGDYLDQVEDKIEIDVFKLNDLYFVFVAGEPYSSLDFIENGIVISYSNGYPGYIYDPYMPESYESVSSLLAKTTLERLKLTIKQMIDELKSIK